MCINHNCKTKEEWKKNAAERAAAIAASPVPKAAVQPEQKPVPAETKKPKAETQAKRGTKKKKKAK